jgi:hypothetical protein
MIAAPVTAALLLDHPSEQIARIALASLVGLSATLGFIVSFAWVASRGHKWWLCFAAAALSFFTLATVIRWLAMPTEISVLLGCLSPWVARFLMPRMAKPDGPPHIPSSELAFRIGGATVMAAALIVGAGSAPEWISGLLMAWPITGSILPAFTQHLSGPKATVALLAGFSRGLVGFSVFFLVLALLLSHLSKPLAYGIALLSAAVIAWLLSLQARGPVKT